MFLNDSRRLVYIALLYSLAGVICVVQANKVTPSHVYQRAENVANLLLHLHRENESQVVYTDFKVSSRRPRHVIQKAREVYQRLQLLRYLNGLKINEVPKFPVKEIEPEQVYSLVNLILQDARELLGPFHAGKIEDSASLSPDKTPTDVYLKLVQVADMINSLELPSVVPNDVYVVTRSINSDIDLITQKQYKRTYTFKTKPSQQKKPVDVFHLSRKLLNDLQRLCRQNKNYCPPGGVILPEEMKGVIKPAHVLDVMNNVLAELGSIKVGLGVDVPTEIHPAVSGKTPSNVYDQIRLARNKVRIILQDR